MKRNLAILGYFLLFGTLAIALNGATIRIPPAARSAVTIRSASVASTDARLPTFTPAGSPRTADSDGA